MFRLSCLPIDEQLCGNLSCYRPSEKTCFRGGKLCDNGERPCGEYCFDPKYHTCYNTTLCKSGERLCGSKCFDPNYLTCSRTQLCQLDERACGNVCYDPSTHRCFVQYNNALCPLGLEVCSATQHAPNKHVCYLPNESDCVRGRIYPKRNNASRSSQWIKYWVSVFPRCTIYILR